jgi:hypothetical protein
VPLDIVENTWRHWRKLDLIMKWCEMLA